MKEDTLHIAGEKLFSAGLLRDHLTEQVRLEILRVFKRQAAERRQVRPLHINRAFGAARFSGAVTLLPEATMTVINARTVDGRQVAEHRSAIAGEAAYLRFASSACASADHLPRGSVQGGNLIITVAFGEDDLPFVATLAQAELELIQQLLEQQRDELARFNSALPSLVRRLVAEQWPHLTGGGASAS
jgi:hypothetical protein